MKKTKITTKNSDIKQAVILCGGLGSRLKEITKITPKPLILVNKIPMVQHLIKYFCRFGIKEVLLLCCYKYYQFKKKFHNKTLYGARIKCINEKKRLGTSGALYNAKKKLDNNFILSNGDTLFDINLSDLVRQFRKKNNAVCFISLKKTKKNKKFDSFELNKDNSVKIDTNKKSPLVNSGLIICSKKILKFLKKKGSLEKDVYPQLINRKKIYAKEYSEKFIDMGRTHDLKKMPGFIKKFYYKPALFLDRDGVINKDVGYANQIKDFIWRNNIKKFVKNYNDKNFYVIVITNQSGIGRGYYSEKDMHKLHNWMIYNFREYGANIDDIFYSPYYKYSKNHKFRKDKKLRKPNIGMIKLAQKKWNINMKKSIFIGDNLIDKKTAINAGLGFKILKFEDKII